MEKNTKRNLLTVGAIASIVALGGTVGANAASQVTSADIKDQTIQSRDIAADGVGKSEIRTGAVGSLEILNQSIQSYDIDAEAVGTSEIRNNTITRADINDSTEASFFKEARDFAADADADIINEAKRHATEVAQQKADVALSVALDGVGSVREDVDSVQEQVDNLPASVPAFEGAVYRSMTYNNGGGGSATVACADAEDESKGYVAISGGVQGSTVDNQSADGFAVTSSFPGRMDWNTNTPKENRLDGWVVLGNGVHTDTLTVWALCVPTDEVAVEHGSLDN